MIPNIHHPSCPAGHTAGAPCICVRRRPRRDRIGEAIAFAAMLAAVVSIPLYLLWRIR